MDNKDEIKKCEELGIHYRVYNFDFSEPVKNPDYEPPEIADDKEWILDIYKNILNATPDNQDGGVQYWIRELSNGKSRGDILKYFKRVALEDNRKNEAKRLSDHIKSDGQKKILFVLKQSLGDSFICTALFNSIKDRYKNYHLYVATSPQFFDIFRCNDLVYDVIPYDAAMENELSMTGGKEPLFDVYFNPAVSTQRQLNYLSNDKIDVKL